MNQWTKYLLILLCLLSSQSASIAQNTSISPKRSPFQLDPNLSPGDYLADGIIFRVKEKYRPFCTDQGINMPLFRGVSERIGVVQVNKAFPNVPPPAEHTDGMGRKMIDLSLIYELQFNGAQNLEASINHLLATGYFEYVEPVYLYKTLFNPSDPDTAAQYYISLLQARDAWDLSKGDSTVVIGIVDTGTSFTHPDLAEKHVFNENDTIDGLDNDGDGFVDNYMGWDFGGTTYYSGGDNDPSFGGTIAAVDHGVIVSGPAVAATDNGVNIASIGFNCMLLPVKASIDQSPYIYRGYQGLVYAADHGAHIINLSWGGTGESRMGRDAVDYATINKGALVVVAGGNTPADLRFIPATYHNVIGVGGTQQNDDFWISSANFGTTYNYLLDLCAPSRDILSIRLNGGLFSATGTSLGAPMVAGAAGLVKARYPQLSNYQVGQRVRVTADQTIYQQNPTYYAEKMGRGRLNAYRAVADSAISIRVLDYQVTDDDGVVSAGDTVDLPLRFVNALSPAQNVEVSLSVPTISQNLFEVIHGDCGLGDLNTLDTTSLRLAPFRLYIRPNTPAGYIGYVRVGYTANGYTDYEYLRIDVDANYLTLAENRLEISFNGRGRWGFMNFPILSQGQGWRVDGEGSLMADAGFLVGTASNMVVDNFENEFGSANNHFDNVSAAQLNQPGTFADAEIRTVYTDAGAGANALGITVEQNSYQYELAPDDDYIIQEYILTNNSATDSLKGVYAGMYYDIEGYWTTNNFARYDSVSRTIYNVRAQWRNLWHMGVTLLTNDSLHGYADAISNFNFTEADKWAALTSDPRTASVDDADVMHFASAGPFDLPPGASHTVAFAMVVADSLDFMRDAADRARQKYNCIIRQQMSAQVDLGGDRYFCNGDSALLLQAGGGFASYEWSDGSTGSDLNVTEDGTYWVRVTDANGCDDYDQVTVTFGEQIAGGFDCTPQLFYAGDTITFTDTTLTATEWGWNFGDGSLSCPIYPTVTHSYQMPGSYEVELYVGNGTCTDTVLKTIQVDTLVGLTDEMLASNFTIFPNPSTGSVKYVNEIPQSGPFKIRVRNHLGQIVRAYAQDKQEVRTEGQIDLSGQSAGVYLIEMEMGDIRLVQKLILQN